jgi:hypothetical protein
VASGEFNDLNVVCISAVTNGFLNRPRCKRVASDCKPCDMAFELQNRKSGEWFSTDFVANGWRVDLFHQAFRRRWERGEKGGERVVCLMNAFLKAIDGRFYQSPGLLINH